MDSKAESCGNVWKGEEIIVRSSKKSSPLLCKVSDSFKSFVGGSNLDNLLSLSEEIEKIKAEKKVYV